MELPSPQAVAMLFSKVLRSWLPANEMAIAIILNRSETSPNVCHSHDYCDANMAMLEAMKLSGVENAEDLLENDDFGALWDAAWDVAKSTEFDAGGCVLVGPR